MAESGDDLAPLRARVDAAASRAAAAETEHRTYALRLADLASIVEGALARQKSELDALKVRLAGMTAERDQATAARDGALAERQDRIARIERLGHERRELREMVLTLLSVVEGRGSDSLRQSMVRLENVARGLLPADAFNGDALNGSGEAMPPSNGALVEVTGVVQRPGANGH